MKESKVAAIIEEAKGKDPIAAMEHITRSMQRLSEGSLERGKQRAEKRARRKNFMNKITRSFTGYETSPTFYDPTVIEIEIEKGTAFTVLRARGIERPHVKDLMIDSTYRLYHHESGIVGLMQRKGNEFTRVTRIPTRVAREIGLEEIAKTYPEIYDGLKFEVTDSGILRAYFDGDLSYTEEISPESAQVPMETRKMATEFTRVLPPVIAEALLESLDPSLAKLNRTLRSWDEKLIDRATYVGGLSNTNFSRSREEMHDFETCEDLKRKSGETRSTPYNMLVEPSSYSAVTVHNVNSVVGRLYAASGLGKSLVSEILVPIALLRKLRSEGKVTEIDLVDRFIKLDIMLLEGLEEDHENVRCNAGLKGDLVLEKNTTNRKDYDILRREVNKLGSEYLERRVSVFGFM